MQLTSAATTRRSYCNRKKYLRHLKDSKLNIFLCRLDQPNLLRKNRHMELWYKPDFKFRFPTALLYFYFITPLSLRSPRE